MNVLSLGNSFSQDAQHYLHRLAAHNGLNIRTVNLNIGACTLQQHYWNMLDDRADYTYEFNGESTGLKVSIRRALASCHWDVVTLQQASRLSARPWSYSPYIEELAAYIRKYCPHTRLMIHETWAYADASDRLKAAGFEHGDDMLAGLRDAYKKAAEAISAYGIIPGGEAMRLAERGGITEIHRDSAHAGLGAGRYLLALTWLKTLAGIDISEDSFNEFDVPVTDEERAIVIRAVNEATKYFQN